MDLCGRHAGVERVPDLLGEEGHEGREQAQRGLEDGDQGGERGGGVGEGFFVGVAGGDGFAGDFEVEAELDDFEVPVAEVAPEELVDGVGGFVEAVVGERGVGGGGRFRRGGRGSSGIRGVGRGVRPGTSHRVELDGAPGFAGAAGRATSMPASRARSRFMKRKRAAFQILLAKAR